MLRFLVPFVIVTYKGGICKQKVLKSYLALFYKIILALVLWPDGGIIEKKILGGIFVNQKRLIARIAFAAVAIIGLALSILTRANAVCADATATGKLVFALSLIALIVGAVLFVVTFARKERKTDIRKLTMAAMFAALCYVGFAYLRVDIPIGTEKSAFHLGNVFVVLGALFLGGLWGGMAGAVGLSIADLTSGYATSAPKTFLMKLGIGLIAGAVAHGIFRIGRGKEARRAPLPIATAVSCAAGMAFNVVADPIVGYFYKSYVLSIPQDAASIWVKLGAVTTLVNAVIAVVAATVLYLALRPALERSRLIP